MSTVELLRVEDSFQISGRGVVLTPDFSVPDGWKDRAEPVVVVKPDGQQFEATARFSLSHFNLVDPQASIDKRWRVIVLLSDRTKEDVPTGSRVFVSQDARDAILRNKNA